MSTGGLISAAGNVTGVYILGNGSLLTGLGGGTAIVNGTTNVSTAASGNANISIAGTSNVAVFTTTGVNITGTISANGNVTGGNILTGGLISATGNVTAGNVSATNYTGTTVSTSGNVTGGNILTGGLVSAGGNITAGNISATNHTGTAVSVSGNVTGGNILTGGLISATGNITAGNISATNHTGTIVSVTGNVTGAFFVGTATSAQYADLAENYLADADYDPGTVLEFGGAAEVTIASDETVRVAGIVSTNPAHLMNSHLTGDFVVALALIGRVPCKVRGTITKGDMLVSGSDGYARSKHEPSMCTVIGKSLEDSTGDNIIEVVVGRL